MSIEPAPFPSFTTARGHPERRPRLAAAVVLALCAAPPALSEEQPPRVRADMEEQTSVRLLVARLRIEGIRPERTGECVALGLDDIEVIVQGDGKTRSSASVHDAAMLDLDRTVQPTLHALVIDSSASMLRNFDHALHAASEYVRQLDPVRERGMVVTFDENVVLKHGPTGEREDLLQAIESARMGGRTSLLDALVYTLRELDAHAERPVLVVLSDGADTASVYDADVVIEEMKSRRDLTIFTIGLGLDHVPARGETRRLLGRLAASTDGRFFDIDEATSLKQVFLEIRDILGTEALLSVVDPDPRAAGPGRVRVRSLDRDCHVTVLPEAEARPSIPRPYRSVPRTFRFSTWPAFVRFTARGATHSVDRDCAVLAEKLGVDPVKDPGWLLRVRDGGIQGCCFDVVRGHGPLYSPRSKELMDDNDDVALRTRPFRIDVPPLGALAARPEALMDALAAGVSGSDTGAGDGAEVSRDREGPHARPYHDSPRLVHGTTFLDARELIALSLFHYPDYREFALDRLRRSVERRLAPLEERYRKEFPELPADAARTAARESYEGQRIRARAEAPSQTDLLPYLAAWLGDIDAHELFGRWERIHVDRLVQGAGSDDEERRFFDAWERIRQVFRVPSHARVVTLLTPIRDPLCDCIGFWRVVLPRPTLLEPRTRFPPGRLPLDLVADLPLGYWALRRFLAIRPGLAEHLRGHGYRSTEVRYGLRGKPETHEPPGAFRAATVELVLESADAGAGPGRMELVASVALPLPHPPDGAGEAPPRATGLGVDGARLEPDLEALEVWVDGDPALQALVRK